MSASGSRESLHRHLTFFDVYALSVGSVIGTGIFFLPGKAAAAMGPAAVIPLLIGACLAGLLVLCYAEAAGRFRGTGGAMRYAPVIGNFTRKVVPFPSSLSTSICPLWASTIILLWKRPIPVPCFLVVLKGRNRH